MRAGRGLTAFLAAMLLALPLAATAVAQTPPPEKRVLEAGEYQTRGGATLPNMRVGYQTAGKLSASGDNAVLITHHFTGNAQAFGRAEGGGNPGWWDAIIGPGKPIDTERFFVISSDTPINLNTRDPRTTTTGPATVNPATGRPYAMEFPVLSIRDFVEVQKRLLDSLGVRRLALVAGPSMGALQAIEWAAAYPEMVERIMPVIGTGEMDAFLQGWMAVWEAPIRLDPNWRNGDYYAQGREPPLRGLAEALKIITLQANDRGGFSRFDHAVPQGQDPARKINDSFAVERFLDETAAARARNSDANSLIYLARANQLFLNEYPDTASALGRSRASWLVIPSVGDRVFPLEYGRALVETLRRAGRQVTVAELSGGRGHLEGLLGVAQAEDAIRTFLAP